MGLNSGRALLIACLVLCWIPAQGEPLAVGGVARVHGDLSHDAILVLRRRGGSVHGSPSCVISLPESQSSGRMCSGLWAGVWNRETGPVG